jgi:flagellar protein FliS
MDDRLRNFYLESTVRNATPGAMLVMLYDGLVMQAEVAESEIAAAVGTEEHARAGHTIRRCIGILTELLASLRPEHDAALCAGLANLYRFFTGELYEALATNDPRRIATILPLLRKLRTTWTQAQNISSKAQLAGQVEVVAA